MRKPLRPTQPNRVSKRCASNAHAKARLRLEALEARDVPATIDLTASGASAAVGAALVQQTNIIVSGSGVFNSFLRIGGNQDVVQGINTSARPVQFDEKSDPHTRDLLLSEVPIVTINGTAYRQFVLDINQTGSNPQLSVDELRVYVSNSAGLSGYNTANDTFAGLNPIFDLDAGGDNSILLNYNKGGSGKADMFFYVPSAAFGASTYVYLYSKFGEQAPNNDGFEDWGLLPNRPAPTIAIDKVTVSGTRRGDGIEVQTGAGLTWVYTVTNTGNVSLNRVTVTDDNGTQAKSDDFRAVYVSGDVNANGQLDVGEKWVFTATGTARFNSYSNVGSVTGTMVGSNRTVSARDVSSYVIPPPPSVAASVNIEKRTVSGSNSGDGILVRAGSAISWTYTVTNTGVLPLDQVSVIDDNGTPDVTTDDFQARYVSGDSNRNGRLEVGETWTFRATGFARRNSYTNIGTVFARIVGTTDVVTARDASSYFTRAAVGTAPRTAPVSKRFLITPNL